MSRFLFNEFIIEAVCADMETMNANIAESEQKIRQAKEKLSKLKGFGSEGIATELEETSGKRILYMEDFQKAIAVLRDVKGTVEKYTNMSFAGISESGNTSETGSNTGAYCDTGIVSGNNDSEQSQEDNIVSDGITYYKDEYDRTTYRGDDGLERTIFEGRSTLRHDADGGLHLEYNFGQGYGRGYVQNPGTGVWWYGRKNVDGNYECNATAAANTSAINGKLVEPSFFNDDTNWTRVNNYAHPLSSNDIALFTQIRLNKGYATEIYFDYVNKSNGAGHALTVVGAKSNATSIYDLRVLDPSTGSESWFGEVVARIGNGDNGRYYVCETSGYYEENSAMMGETEYWSVWNDEYWLDLRDTRNWRDI